MKFVRPVLLKLFESPDNGPPVRQVTGPVFTDGANTDVPDPGTALPPYSETLEFVFGAETNQKSY